MPGVLSFTFDDGPDEQWTHAVLGQLERCGVNATFFMIGERVCSDPRTARMVLTAGHDVQLHCHRHIRHSDLSERDLWDDTELALASLREIGACPSLWRTPWGICTEASRRVARELGLRLVGWSIDTHDWRGDQVHSMLASAEPKLAAGGPVLMHDALGPGATRDGCGNTIALIPRLAAAAQQRHMMLAPMSRRCGAGVRDEARGANGDRPAFEH